MSKTIRSTYSDPNFARIERVRGALTAPQFQSTAVMAEVARREKASPPPPVERWGAHMGVNPGSIPSDLALQKISGLGLGWVTISPERGWLSSTATRDLVSKCHAYGLKVQAVAQEPKNAAGRRDYSAVVANPGPFADYCAGLAVAGADALTVGCEWNNPGGDFWYQPDATMSGPAKITVWSLAAVRKVSQIPVYPVGWCPAGGNLAPVTCQRALDAQIKALGVALSQLAGPSHHPYCFNHPLTLGVAEHHRDWNAFLQTPDVYAVAQSDGLSGGMSLGEFGLPSAGTQTEWPNWTFTEAIQHDGFVEYFAGFEQMRSSGVPISFVAISTAIDGDATTRPIEGSMGLFRRDGSEKPAAAVVRNQALKAWPLGTRR